jgi:hypothetical protein
MTIDSPKPTAETVLSRQLNNIKSQSAHADFQENDGLIYIENFLPKSLLHPMLESLPKLEPYIHRSFIPKHKKGGSVSRFDLDQHAPIFSFLYTSVSLTNFLSSIIGEPLLPCPKNDPHAYALYSYDQEGDHIGFHYDKSYYKGSRYTCLIGLVEESCCVLEYELFKKNILKETEMHSKQISPGSLILFNGDNIRHRVTPASAGDKRVVLTLEYLTDRRISRFGYVYGQLKDAFVYFGLRKTLRRLLKNSQ